MRVIFFLLLSFTFNFAQIINTEIATDTLNNTAVSEKVKIKYLPFAYYDNSLGIVFGGLGGVKGFAQKETYAKIGGIISTSGTYYGFIQVESFQFPFFPRMFFRPDIYIGKVKDIELYLNKPKVERSSPGANDSKNSDKVLMDGNDWWYEFGFKYLLPFGHGKENPIINPKFKNGLLISGETGGSDWNPLKSGRSFFETKFFYRHMDLEGESLTYNKKTLGVEFALSHENMDYFFNPTRGSYKRISYLTDWGAVGKASKFSAWRFDHRWYIPLYDREKNELPAILAVNIYSMYTPSWYDYHLETNSVGEQNKVYHRPLLFVSSNLGGVRQLRSFQMYRFYDKASIYYSVEFRKNILWNPFNSFSLTKKLGIDFIQLVAFADAGRVAPEWNLNTLHKDMKWSLGGGFRLFMDGLVVRVDLAGGPEGVLSQMFVDHPF